MTDATPRTIREVVGLFQDRLDFEAAVHHLIDDAGFARTDLSVLDSHETLEAAGAPGKTWKDVLTALVGEIQYEGPLVTSGGILLAGGPTAAVIASVIGAATAGVVVKDILDEVTATPHTENFANALAAGGVIMWVYCPTEAQEKIAEKVLEKFGAHNVHVYERRT